MSGVTMSWSIPVNSDGSSGDNQIDAAQLWAGLLHKAENPVAYVPAITDCRVLDRFPGGFTREIRKDGRTVFQRVEVSPEELCIVYRQPGDPELEFIMNQIDRGADGGLLMTMAVSLAPEATERALEESRFIEATDAYFTDALRSVVDEIRAGSGGLDTLIAAA
ncbi:AtaL-like protein [Kitasatospora sp. NPDC002227]|uniref:AtaL-like protein n=1 Tax=Kitasatospora sp. NPDC002227 TaxID=3154773 RepID=UPI00332D351E